MELRCRNLHIADIGKKKEENNGRKASSDLERSLKGDCKTPKRLQTLRTILRQFQ